jgi:GDPmannose 4,6-dehydratase
MSKKALISGITGQDGAYLSKLLLESGYKVYGVIQRGRQPSLNRLAELDILKHINFIEDELSQIVNIKQILVNVQPDELYNLSGQSVVQKSWAQPMLTMEVNGLQPMLLLEGIRLLKIDTRYFQASSSEIFGDVKTSPQNEFTKIQPDNPYGISKAFAHWNTSIYRKHFGIHSCSGILYNHESPLRGIDFVTRKITVGLAKILHGHIDVLELGNLDVQRDWGFAGDYVQGMWLMMQQNTGDDYILATGKLHSVRDFVELACEALGICVEWIGQAENTIAINKLNGRLLVKVNKKYYRVDDKYNQVGDASKAKVMLNWHPVVKFSEMINMMVKSDYDRVKKGKLL